MANIEKNQLLDVYVKVADKADDENDFTLLWLTWIGNVPSSDWIEGEYSSSLHLSLDLLSWRPTWCRAMEHGKILPDYAAEIQQCRFWKGLMQLLNDRSGHKFYSVKRLLLVGQCISSNGLKITTCRNRHGVGLHPDLSHYATSFFYRMWWYPFLITNTRITIHTTLKRVVPKKS